MSGVKRKTKYRKHVERSVLEDLPEPAAERGEEVVRALGARGGNLVEIETARGEKGLCRLPQKFRKVVWVKRGGLLIVRAASEADRDRAADVKVQYCVEHVLFPEQVKHLRAVGKLPAVFDAVANAAEASSTSTAPSQPASAPPVQGPSSGDGESGAGGGDDAPYDDLFARGNPNRRRVASSRSDSDDEDDDDDDDDDDDANEGKDEGKSESESD